MPRQPLTPEQQRTILANLWRDIERLTRTVVAGALDPLAGIFTAAFLFDQPISLWLLAPLAGFSAMMKTIITSLISYENDLASVRKTKLTELLKAIETFTAEIAKVSNDPDSALTAEGKLAIQKALLAFQARQNKDDEILPDVKLETGNFFRDYLIRILSGFNNALGDAALVTFPVLTAQTFFIDLKDEPHPYRDVVLYGLLALDGILIGYNVATAIFRDRFGNPQAQLDLAKELKTVILKLRALRSSLDAANTEIKNANPILGEMVTAIDAITEAIEPNLGKSDAQIFQTQALRDSADDKRRLLESVGMFGTSMTSAHGTLRRRGTSAVIQGMFPNTAAAEGQLGLPPKSAPPEQRKLLTV